MPYNFNWYGTFLTLYNFRHLRFVVLSKPMPYNFIRYRTYALQLLVPALVALSVPMPYNFVRYGTYALHFTSPTYLNFIKLLLTFF
jgi:hypothetical protein